MKIWNWKLYGQFLNLLHRLFYPKIFLFFKFWESLKYLIQNLSTFFCYIKFLSLKKQAELLMDIVPFDVILYLCFYFHIHRATIRTVHGLVVIRVLWTSCHNTWNRSVIFMLQLHSLEVHHKVRSFMLSFVLISFFFRPPTVVFFLFFFFF